MPYSILFRFSYSRSLGIKSTLVSHRDHHGSDVTYKVDTREIQR